MNKKLLAVAVSTALMAPVASQAADVTVYGRINNALEITDTDDFTDPDGFTEGGSTTDISSVSSRFGFKASSDLGNGMTASARYEFATTTDKEQANVADLRIGTVGLSGGFGSINVGNQWSAYYTTVGTHIDPTYAVGSAIYSGIVGGPYRASNTVKYSNSFGPLYLELDVRLNDKDEDTDVAEVLNGDGAGIGLSYAFGDTLTLAVSHDSEDGAGGADDTDRTGFAAKWVAGDFWAMVGWQEREVGSTSADQVSLYAGTSIGESTSVMIGFQDGESEFLNDGGFVIDEADQLILGVYHNMGGGLKLYYEGTSIDYTDRGDKSRHLLGMRIDF